MHRAPAISTGVYRPTAAIGWFLFFAVGVLLLTAVAAYQINQAHRLWLLAAVSISVVFLCLYGWYVAPVGRLSWDGQRWFWSGFAHDQACVLAVKVDFQSTVLVQVAHNSEGRAWLFLKGRSNAVHWAKVRRALASPAVACTDVHFL